MYIITNKKASRAIELFIIKEVKRRDGSIFKTVQEKDKVFVEQFLNRFYRAFESVFDDKHFAAEIFAKRLKEIDALTIGEAAMVLGAGRQTLEDVIDHAVGIKLLKKIGDKIITKIRSIEYFEKKVQVYNFEVEEDNSYTCNNVIVHN